MLHGIFLSRFTQKWDAMKFRQGSHFPWCIVKGGENTAKILKGFKTKFHINFCFDFLLISQAIAKG